MKKFLTLILCVIGLSAFAQKEQKDIRYYYYNLNQDQHFMDYIKARKTFDLKKTEFLLPKSEAALKELKENESKILRNERSYTEFLTKYNMKNAGEYARLWFAQLTALKTFLKKNPEFSQLTATERQNIIDKWYYSDVASN